MYEYLDYIPTVPQRHRKFVDEAAYSERDLIAKKGCKSRPGDRIVLGDLALREQNDAFYSVIFLASITHPKGGALLSIRQGALFVPTLRMPSSELMRGICWRETG
eukprot:g64579.t1